VAVRRPSIDLGLAAMSLARCGLVFVAVGAVCLVGAEGPAAALTRAAGSVTGSRLTTTTTTVPTTDGAPTTTTTTIPGAPSPSAATSTTTTLPPTPSGPKASAAAVPSLVGTLELQAGSCASGETGSYFRMVQPGGSLTAGPFVSNGDSICAVKTWTTLAPGTDGGIVTGSYQPQPATPFSSGGNSSADRIVKPQTFFAVDFGVSTNPTDPQTKTAVPVPRIVDTGGRLSGDLSAVAVSWNGQFFNQGSPKPGGATSAQTTAVEGTYDTSTHAYTLTWTSQVQGGPFNNFVGVWHLQGTFQSTVKAS